MTREEMSPEDYESLIKKIGEILIRNGLKATTMDSIASELQISKRTLYEIFSNKADMVNSALESFHKRHTAELKKIFASSSNVLEGILKGFLFQRDEMSKANADFFRDMDSFFAEAKKASEYNNKKFMEGYMSIIQKGVEEGVFRKEINYVLQFRLLWIQMESLKRMEELFPPDITILDAFDSISIGFLRTIATPAGMLILDDVLASRDKTKTESDNANS